MVNKIARVFPRRTNATPTDELAFYDVPGMFMPKVDEVHVSITFTWDKTYAEYLASQWRNVAPVKLGGPGWDNTPEYEFNPGMYIKDGYTITSRGCSNRCWFCNVWKRHSDIIELKIKDGWNILDDNLLQCSTSHINNVFTMLEHQPHKAEFTGGLEAARLEDWHCEMLAKIKPKQMFFAYDTPDDYEPLVDASIKLKRYDLIKAHNCRCYVLCGFPKDNMSAAEKRMKQCIALGLYPQAMLWRNAKGDRDSSWMKFARAWARPAIIYSRMKESENGKN